jgi:hypothetical protein
MHIAFDNQNNSECSGNMGSVDTEIKSGFMIYDKNGVVRS